MARRNMKMNFTKLDLDSSMNSAQGLLSFMTDASKQIKTFLDDDQKSYKKQQRQRKHLLDQLNNINVRIPSIDMQLNHCYTPASPTPSLDSTGSMSSEEDETLEFPSCSVSNNRKRKASTFSNNNIKKHRQNNLYTEYSNTYLNGNTNNNIKNNQNTATSFGNNTTSFGNSISTKSYDSFDYIVPSPTPDFDDLVNCMLTDEFASPFDYTSYLMN